jgi:hypothetical protein
VEVNMQIKVTRTHRGPSGGTWYVGRVDGRHFEALVFAEPSQYGIDGGQVSKLYAWDGPKKKVGNEIAVFERGWELEPSEEVRPVVEFLVRELSRLEGEAGPDERMRGQ